MRMIDKAGGELGKTIAHPLQSKVDRILFLNLGDRKDWVVGMVIRFDRFDPVRNKPYVRQRLEELGFTPNPNGTNYKFTGVNGYSQKSKTSNARIKSKLELASVALKKSEVRIKVVEQLMLSGRPINSSAITKDDKTKLGSVVSQVKNGKGIDIESLRVKESGVDFMIYAPKAVYEELTGGAIRCNTKEVAAYLEKHGEISATKTGIPSRKLNYIIYQLRNEGYEIEALGIGQRKAATYKLISKQ